MLAFVLFFAAFLRIINLNQSLWLDEAFQAKAIANFSLSGLLNVYLKNDFNPPLSYLVNFFFSKIFGNSEVALRLPSVVFGVATVYLVYLIAREVLPKKVAHWPALLLATSGLHLYYSQEARMYSLVTLAVTGSFFCLIRLIRSGSHQWQYFFFLTSLLYSHYLAWFVLPAQAVAVFLLDRSKFKKVFLLQLASVLTFIPWLPTLFSQVKVGLASAAASPAWSSVVGGVSFKNLSLIPVKFLVGRIAIDNNFVFALVLAVPLALSSWLIILALKAKPKLSFAKVVIFSWLVLPFLLIVLVSVKVPVLAYFRLLFLLPAFYLGLVLGASLLKKNYQGLALAFFLVLNLTASAVYLLNPKFHREDWRGLVKVLVEKNLNLQPVVIIPVVDAPLKYYYAGNIVASDNLASVLDARQIWLVPYAEAIFDPSLTSRQKLELSGFKPNFVRHFTGDLILIQYIK